MTTPSWLWLVGEGPVPSALRPEAVDYLLKKEQATQFYHLALPRWRECQTLGAHCWAVSSLGGVSCQRCWALA